MDGIGVEVSKKIRSAIKAKLMELGAYVDEELPDYIMVMVANKKSKPQMDEDLMLFLGSNTEKFTSWLHQVLQKLQEVTVGSIDAKKTIKEKLTERKRKSSTGDSNGDPKKKRKSTESKVSDNITKKLKDSSDDDATRTSLKESNEESVVKQSKSDSEPKSAKKMLEDSAISEPDTKELCSQEQVIVKPIVQSVTMQSIPLPKENLVPAKVQEPVRKNPSGNALTDIKLSSVNVGNTVPQEVTVVRRIISGVPPLKLQQLSVESDEEDHDFINIKADAEADDLVNELSEDLPVASEPIVKRIPFTSGVKRVSVAPILKHLAPSPRKTAVISVRQAEADQSTGPRRESISFSRMRFNVASSEGSSNIEGRRVITLKDANCLEPVTSTTHDHVQRTAIKRVLLSCVGAVVMKKDQNEDEEEYDPTNPAVGSVASVVRVKARPKLPASTQASKNLILKAMAEAQKSVANAPVRGDPKETISGLYTRKYREKFGLRNVEKIAVTLPNIRPDPKAKEVPSESQLESKLVEGEEVSEEMQVSPKEVKEQISEDASSTGHMFNLDTDAIMVDADNVNVTVKEAKPAIICRPVHETTGMKQRIIQGRSIACAARAESPQFVVTLDGIDSSLYEEVDGGQFELSADDIYVDEEVETVEEQFSLKRVSELEKRSVISPIIFKSLTSEKKPKEVQAVEVKPKHNERCKYWPACRQGDKCEFHHPTTSCKAFPNCKYGEKCLYIHPNCKFDAACTRRDCPFTHASPRNIGAITPVVVHTRPVAPPAVCRFFPKCTNMNCQFYHPRPCRYGRFCNKFDCTFVHSEVPTKDKLKWISPSSKTLI